MYCHIVLSLVVKPVCIISCVKGKSYWATGLIRSKRLPVSMSAVVGVEQPYFESIHTHPHSFALMCGAIPSHPPVLYNYTFTFQREIYTIFGNSKILFRF
jgi:hypothetical protein